MGPLLLSFFSFFSFFLSFFSEKKRGVGEGETLSGDCGLYCLHGQSSVLEPALVATCVGAGGSLQSPTPPPPPKKRGSKSLIYCSSVHRTSFLSWKGCRTD